jgi:uncharacterized DUF497 family protein
MEFEWDSRKARSNLLKHGIDFADAVGVLEDELGLTIRSEIVEDEQRFVTIGSDFILRTLVVVYTYRTNRIRIVSARPATRRERQTYEQRRD